MSWAQFKEIVLENTGDLPPSPLSSWTCLPYALAALNASLPPQPTLSLTPSPLAAAVTLSYAAFYHIAQAFGEM